MFSESVLEYGVEIQLLNSIWSFPNLLLVVDTVGKLLLNTLSDYKINPINRPECFVSYFRFLRVYYRKWIRKLVNESNEWKKLKPASNLNQHSRWRIKFSAVVAWDNSNQIFLSWNEICLLESTRVNDPRIFQYRIFIRMISTV